MVTRGEDGLHLGHTYVTERSLRPSIPAVTSLVDPGECTLDNH